MPNTIREAVEEFQRKRIDIYRADRDQILRDTNSAQEVTRDHSGRWLFELVQNADDARATRVHVAFTENAIYVADDGLGLFPDAVRSISGTHLSLKGAGTIGRKGVGFKAVYEVSVEPTVFTTNNEGITFSKESAARLLQQHELLTSPDKVPYQWLPFFCSRKEAEATDAVLRDLQWATTVIKLPLLSPTAFERAEVLVSRFHSHTLLTFNNLSSIEVSLPSVGRILVTVERAGHERQVQDSRQDEGKPVRWACYKISFDTPDSLLDALETSEERQRLSSVGILIAAPTSAAGRILPTDTYLPIHVYYPTEQHSPVPLLMHGDFVVKSDRTALLPLDANAINAWLALQLAEHVVKFALSHYDARSPAAYLELIAPTTGLETDSVPGAIWEYIRESATRILLLPNRAGELQITPADAILVEATASPAAARAIFGETHAAGHLVHPSVEASKTARSLVRKLGARSLSDDDIRAVIAKEAASQNEPEWAWNCWTWAAQWLAGAHRTEESEQRLAHLLLLPLIPIGGALRSHKELGDSIITWQEETTGDLLPEWCHLYVLDNWFRDRLLSEDERGPIRQLAKSFGILAPGAEVTIRAVCSAIRDYWRKPEGDGGRFLSFLLTSGWEEAHSERIEGLADCPVPTRRTSTGQTRWVAAKRAYFGGEWGDANIELVYRDQPNVCWVLPTGPATPKERRVLEWLGVAPCPRIIAVKPDGNMRLKESSRIITSLPQHTDFELPDTWRLEGVDPSRLDSGQATALLALIHSHWHAYYQSRQSQQVRYRYYSWSRHTVTPFWWHELVTGLRLPQDPTPFGAAPLRECWLDTEELRNTLAPLLPLLDLNSFGERRTEIRNWLHAVVGVRSQLSELTVKECSAILSKGIPALVPAEAAKEHSKLTKVKHWYETCLRVLRNRQDANANLLRDALFLCRKGQEWQYKVARGSTLYVNDDAVIAKAFANTIWIVEGLRGTAAQQLFGLASIGRAARVEPVFDSQLSVPDTNLEKSVNDILPFMYALKRWNQHGEVDSAGLMAKLRGWRVVVALSIQLRVSLPGVGMEHIESSHFVDEKQRLIHLSHDALQKDRFVPLANALEEAINIGEKSAQFELLLRCHNNEERAARLLSAGVPEEELRHDVQEFLGFLAEAGKAVDGQPSPAKPETITATIPPIAPTPQPAMKEKATDLEPAQPRTTRAGLKEIDRIRVSVRQPIAVQHVDKDGTKVAGGGATGTGVGQELSAQEKSELETLSRQVAERELKRLGYSVEQMPQDNPGFDIRATKNSEELRIELKSHLRTSDTVIVTARELQEYLRAKAGTSWRWELWNIDNLASDSEADVHLSRYIDLPDDAITGKQFQVDLRLCTPPE